MKIYCVFLDGINRQSCLGMFRKLSVAITHAREAARVEDYHQVQVWEYALGVVAPVQTCETYGNVQGMQKWDDPGKVVIEFDPERARYSATRKYKAAERSNDEKMQAQALHAICERAGNTPDFTSI